MRRWLTGASISPLVVSFAAHAQAPDQTRNLVKNTYSTSRFLLPNVPQFTAVSPLKDGLIARDAVAPNAQFGVGLVSMSGRNIHGVKIEPEPVPTQNPGITFIVRLGH